MTAAVEPAPIHEALDGLQHAVQQALADPDPVVQLRRCWPVLNALGALHAEVLEMQRDAVITAHNAGMSFSAIGQVLGLSRSLISQIAQRR